MATLHLYEVVPDAVSADATLPVALTADAVADCERRGIEYRVAPDLSDADEFRTRRASYWDDQLSWLDLLDDLLAARLPELRADGARPALLYGRWLKYVLDSVFIGGCELSSLLRHAPDARSVVLWRRAVAPPLDRSGRPDSRRILFDGASVYSRLLPLLAERAGRATVTEDVDRPVETLAATAEHRALRPPSPHRLLHGAGALLESLVRAVPPAARGRGRLTFLLLQQEYDMRRLVVAARRRGHRCLVLAGGAVVDGAGPTRDVVARLAPAAPDARFSDAAASVAAEDSPLWKWPDSWFDVPVSGLLRPQVVYFVERILPELVALTDQLGRLYEDEHVDYVAASVLASPADFAAVEAARRASATESVFVEHGDSALDASALVLLELFQVDHYFSVSAESAEFFRRSGRHAGRPVAEVHVGSYRWREYEGLAKRPWWSRPPSRLRRGRPTLVYAVTGLIGDSRYLFGSEGALAPAAYPDAWYHRLQRALLDVLADQTRFDVIVKLFPSSPATEAVARYAAEKDAPRVRVSREPFTRWLPWADRILLDFPSTAMYEAALAGVPFVCLLHDSLLYRADAVEELEPWTRVVHDIGDAREAVTAFLEERPPRPDLRPEGSDILDTLERLAGRQGR